ncbi:A18 transcript termination helicase [uncultured virus]|nr:A18 transcript termination helicase [uncultured virus]
MAVLIARDLLNTEMALSLKKALTFHPVKPPSYRQPSYYSKTDEDDGVEAFTLDDDHGKTYVRLPFTWGQKQYGLNNDHRPHRPIKMEMRGSPRDDLQATQLNTAIDDLNATRTAIFNLRTGFGKTALSLFVACKVKLLVCILIPAPSDLEDQWIEESGKFTTGKVAAVDVNPKKSLPDDVDIICCYMERTKKIPREVRDAVGLLIIDESHLFCNRTGITAILDFTPKFIIACSATFVKTTTQMHHVMESVVGNKLIKADFDVKFKVTKVMTGIKGDRAKQEKRQGIDWHRLNKSFLYNDDRNQMIVQLVLSLSGEGKDLILTTEVDHVKVLYEMFTNSPDRGNLRIDYLAAKKSQYDDSDILIGNVQKCGTGFDEAGRCKTWNGIRINKVFLVGSFKDRDRLSQAIGRGFRAEYPHIYHFVDNDPTIAAHWREGKKLYDELGADIDIQKIVKV